MGFIAPIVAAIGSAIGGAGGAAAIGSSVLGSAMGRGGGSAARSDYSTAEQGIGGLNDISKTAMPIAKTGISTATANTQTGMGTLDAVKKYWTDILSGSRPAQMAAAAPEINARNEMDAAARAKEGAYGTSRGGGTNSAAQDAETQRLTDISNSIFGTRAKAAPGLTAVGGAQAEVGLQQMTNGLRALGLSEDAIKSIINAAQGNRQTSTDINNDSMFRIGQAIATTSNTIFGED